MSRLSNVSRTLVAISALLFAATFVLPIWKIELHAPQYPEGLGMLIRIDTLSGIKPADLDNLNGLNHYIGMKAIHADAFPALTYMPWIVGVLVLTALLVSAVGRRAPLFAWLGVVALAGAAGFAEFFRWSYRYGHDLAPDAIIKVPGMTYQPPLLGTKQLLNFTATSWPDSGGWLAVLAFVIGVIALLPQLRPQLARSVVHNVAAKAVSVAAVFAFILVGSACASRSTPKIAYGKTDCTVCHMRIVDARYGGLVLNAKGKVNQFESIECLANYAITVTGLRETWVTDFDHPGALVNASTARFVRRTDRTGEMGSNWIALDVSADTAQLRSRFGSAPLSWTQIRALAESNELGSARTEAHDHEG